jgi:hypothetical protein
MDIVRQPISRLGSSTRHGTAAQAGGKIASVEFNPESL